MRKKTLLAIRMVTVLLEIMMTITAVCERGFSCMNRENSLLRKRLGKDTPLTILCALILMAHLQLILILKN